MAHRIKKGTVLKWRRHLKERGVPAELVAPMLAVLHDVAALEDGHDRRLHAKAAANARSALELLRQRLTSLADMGDDGESGSDEEPNLGEAIEQTLRALENYEQMLGLASSAWRRLVGQLVYARRQPATLARPTSRKKTPGPAKVVVYLAHEVAVGLGARPSARGQKKSALEIALAVRGAWSSSEIKGLGGAKATVVTVRRSIRWQCDIKEQRQRLAERYARRARELKLEEQGAVVETQRRPVSARYPRPS
jgi:hypothetical protein